MRSGFCGDGYDDPTDSERTPNARPRGRSIDHCSQNKSRTHGKFIVIGYMQDVGAPCAAVMK